jgi:hypothetical protein
MQCDHLTPASTGERADIGYATGDDFDPDGNLANEKSLLHKQAVAEARMITTASAK